MFTVPASNPHLKRTIRPLYAHHQATAWAGFLDPQRDPAVEILPGTVMARINVDDQGGEVFTPYTGTGVPFGLSAFFVAPSLGVDEVTDSGSNTFTVWVGDGIALFEVLSPAFDAEKVALSDDGSTTLLTGNAQGKLTTDGATPQNAIAELIEASASKITVRPFRPVPTA